jgi:predicted ATPase/class 3 adenylate cyclase
MGQEMMDRPSGAVTFLFTDIEQSTRRWDEQPDLMRRQLAEHDSALKQAVARTGGFLFKHTGDGVIAAFASPRAAVDAAVAAQLQLTLPVRMGICTGEVESRDNDYFGPALNRAARTMSAAHGGQIVVAASTASLVSGIDLIDLGIHRLRDLSQEQHLFQVRVEGLKPNFPPLRTLNALPGNLPAQTTSFLGHEQDIIELAAIARGNRLITLTGVGGVGKTRLALQVAADLTPDFPDGAWFVELGNVTDAGAIGHAVGAVLGIAQQRGATIENSIVGALSGQRLLLLLDNCEHLIEAAAALVQPILARCPQVVVLATSREALMLDGERNWPVASLSVGDDLRSAAVRLFVDRALGVVPDFNGDNHREAIAEICRRLDGIPLAIELAAARVRSLSPAQIRDRLNERFRLLTGSRRALERHQTLRHAVQWSYDLLSPQERTLLARVSVFAGGFSLEACERVCSGDDIVPGSLLGLLDQLVRKSLVSADHKGTAVRFGLLETIRQFGEEHLVLSGEASAMRLGHAQFFADDSTRNFQTWLSPQQGAAYQWLDREIDNLRTAFRWAKDTGCVDLACTIASNIGDMARFVVREEAALWAEEIVDAARAIRHPRLIVLLTWAASTAWSLARTQEAKRYGAEAIALPDDAHFDPFAWAFADLATIALYEGDGDVAVDLITRGAEREGDRDGRFNRSFLPFFLASCGRDQEARAIADETIVKAEATGVPCSIIIAWWGKARAWSALDPAQALACYEHAAALARDTGNRLFESMVVPQMAALQASSNDAAAALRSFKQMLGMLQRSPDLMIAVVGIASLIVLFERIGAPLAAARLSGALARLSALDHSHAIVREATVRLRESLGERTFDEESRRGAAMNLRESTEYAAKQVELSLAEREV